MQMQNIIKFNVYYFIHYDQTICPCFLFPISCINILVFYSYHQWKVQIHQVWPNQAQLLLFKKVLDFGYYLFMSFYLSTTNSNLITNSYQKETFYGINIFVNLVHIVQDKCTICKRSYFRSCPN